MAQALSIPVRRAARWLGSNSWLRPLNDRVALNDLLGQVRPLWSLDRVRARLVDVIEETAGVRTFVLEPNHLWPGFRAGQHVALEVEIDGVRHHRSFSLAGAAGERRLALTVKRQPRGIVSAWLHQQARVGEVLTLSAPAGDFVLPDPLPPKLLMLSAGSGVTPLMSMLRTLRQQDTAGIDIVFLHGCRTPADAIFGHELRALAAAWPALHLLTHYSAGSGRLDADAVRRLVPDWTERQALLCGPEGFMQMARQLWQAHGLEQQLRSESFSGMLPRRAAAAAGQMEVRCLRSDKTFAAGGQALLAEAEGAGLKPKHGCRIGICRSCQCRKLSGTVENLLTGEVSDAPGQTIQLCISAARSDLALDL